MSSPAANALSLHVDVTVSVADLKTWDADRIRAFFDGMAMVREAAHRGERLEEVKAERRQAEEDSRYHEGCLEEIAKTCGIDPR